MSSPVGSLVDSHSADLAVIALGPAGVDGVMDHAPEPGVMFTDDSGHRRDGHVGSHRHDQGFEQKRETTALPRPRHLHQPFATSAAVYSWDTRRKNRLVLEEVQMAPAAFLGVVRLAPICSAFRTGEGSAPLEIDGDLQALIPRVELVTADEPWLGQTESEGEQIFAIHARNDIAGGPQERLQDPPSSRPLQSSLNENLPIQISGEPEIAAINVNLGIVSASTRTANVTTTNNDVSNVDNSRAIIGNDMDNATIAGNVRDGTKIRFRQLAGGTFSAAADPLELDDANSNVTHPTFGRGVSPVKGTQV